MNVANGIRAYALKLCAQHGAGERPIKTPVFNQELCHGHDIRGFLYLINENKSFGRHELNARDNRHPPYEFVGIMRPKQRPARGVIL